MQLLPYEDHDFALTEALETDAAVMRHLGGPTDPARLPEVHRRRLNDPWWFKIVPEPSGPPAGTIGIWAKELDGATIHETGWMVLPAFQGRGIATAALGLLIERVRAEPRFESMHAFPPVTNAPSNALCRRFSFSLLGERDFVYAGRTLRCNHWMLATPSPARPPGWLPKDEYDAIYKRVPRLCVEIVLVDPARGVLLARRDIPPNVGAWHIPGGTVLFGEPLTEAVKRVARGELRMEVAVGGLLGYIEYPSHYENGLDSPVGLAFAVEPADGPIDDEALPSVCAWFSRLPDGLYGEQREFLVRRLGLPA